MHQTRATWATTVVFLLSIPVFAGAQEATPAPAPAPEGSAQPALAPAEAKPEGKKKAEEEIVVTGSRLRRKDLTTPAPVSVITREQLQTSGLVSIGDFLQQIPAQTSAMNQNVNNAGDGQTQISLRGLGANRTLVLVDGKRWVNGGQGAGPAIAGVDLNTIPTAAIDRIEILKDGASALYGSDAIGGVVNIITRKHADYTEASAYAGMTTHGDGTQYDVNVSSGLKGEKGGFFITGGYYNQAAVSAGNRTWAKQAVLLDFTQCDANGNCPAAAVRNSGSSQIPQGRVTVDPTTCPTQLCKDMAAAGFKRNNYLYDPAACAADPTLNCVDGWHSYVASRDAYNYQLVNNLIVPMTRISFLANADYKVGDVARVYAQGSFVNRQSSNLLAPEPFDTGSTGCPGPYCGMYVSASNEFNPFGIDLFSVRRRIVEFNGRSQGFDLYTARAVLGIDGTLPSSLGALEGAFWDVAFSYGRTTGVTSTTGSLNTQKTQNALGPSYQDANGVWQCGTDPTKGGSGPVANCTPVNLFGGPGTITPDQLAALGGYKGINQGWTQLVTLQANVTDELFNLFAERPVAVAFGYEYRAEYGGYTPNSIAQSFLDSDYNGAPTSGSFHVNEGYLELVIPIVSNVVGLEDLELQLAGRLFGYSTFGSGATYKVGLRWSPIRDLTLRGTYSTGFRAPNISDLYGGKGPSAESASDPCAGVDASGSPKPIDPNSALGKQCANGPGGNVGALNNGDTAGQISSTVGGNPNLKPETATMFTAGIVVEPSMVKGLALTVDYWSVDVENTITANTTAVILNGCYPASIGSTAAPNQDFCSDITRNPSTGQIANVNDLLTNTGYTKTSGIDIAAHYTIPTGFGRFTIVFDSVYLLKYDFQVASGKVYNAAGNYDLGSGAALGGLTPRFRFNAGLRYGFEGLTVGLNGRFVGGFTECADADGVSGGGGIDSPGFCSDQNRDPSTGQRYPVHEVSAYLAMDLFVGYDLKTFLGTTSLGVGVRNLFDANPPQVFNTFLTYADPAYDFYGRFVYARLAQKF